jgi:hypothetical protein
MPLFVTSNWFFFKQGKIIEPLSRLLALDIGGTKEVNAGRAWRALQLNNLSSLGRQ